MKLLSGIGRMPNEQNRIPRVKHFTPLITHHVCFSECAFVAVMSLQNLQLSSKYLCLSFLFHKVEIRIFLYYIRMLG